MGASSISEPNYESKWWGYIYDQMMAEMPDLLESHGVFITLSSRR